MPYPQNLGLSRAVDRLRQRNEYNAQRPVDPYDNTGTAAGQYANNPMAGRMTNAQAQGNYGLTGYMPNRTVGGAYGIAGGNPDNRLVGNQLLTQASGNQYRPINGTGMGLAGAWHGGAAPGIVGGRQAWVDPNNPPREATAGRFDQYRLQRPNEPLGPANGLMPVDPKTAQGVAMQQAAETFDARRGGLDARRAAYEARNAPPADMRDYRLGIYQTRQNDRLQKQEAAMAMQQNQMMMGLAYRNPQMAMQMAQLNQRGQLANQQIGLQYAQLGQQGGIAGQNSQDRRYVADQGLQAAQYNSWNARYNEAIKAGNTPDDAAKLAGPPPGLGVGTGAQSPVSGAAPQGGLMGPAGQPAPGGAYKPRKSLLDAQLAQIAALPKDKRAAALRAVGVSDSGDLEYYQRQLDPKYDEPGALRAFADSIFNPPQNRPGYRSPGINYRDNPK